MRLIARRIVNRYRNTVVEELLRDEHGEFTELDRQVAASIANQETIAENVEEEFEEHRTFGEHVSDIMAGVRRVLVFPDQLRDDAGAVDGLQPAQGRPGRVRPLPLHSTQPRSVDDRGHSGPDHHDEPEAGRRPKTAYARSTITASTSRRSSKSGICTKRSTI